MFFTVRLLKSGRIEKIYKFDRVENSTWIGRRVRLVGDRSLQRRGVRREFRRCYSTGFGLIGGVLFDLCLLTFVLDDCVIHLERI